MKMKARGNPQADASSPHAVMEVDVSDELYELTCPLEEAKLHCWDVLFGHPLRRILTDSAHYCNDSSYAVMTPANAEYAMFVGVKLAHLRVIQPKSRALMDAFLASYRPDVSDEDFRRHQQLHSFIAAANELDQEIEKLKGQLAELEGRKAGLLDCARRVATEASWDRNTKQKLDPEYIYRGMKYSVDENMKRLQRSRKSDQGNLYLVLELLAGEGHAIRFYHEWALIGEEVGDKLYKALLQEAGFTQEAALAKYRELEAMTC